MERNRNKIEELKYEIKKDGMGGRTSRYIEAWRVINKENFIKEGFYLRFKD
jgi:recombination DNA repair RAD52 pathway protein